MSQQSSMDYGVVSGIANGFAQVGQTLKVVAKALEAAIMILKATAFISLGATKFLEMYLANIKPKVVKLSETCEEMAEDLRIAIREHQQADSSAAPTFN